MANQMASNPWIFTETAADFTDRTKSFPHRVRVTAFVFDGYAADTDEAELRDFSGRSVVKMKGQTGLAPVVVNHSAPAWVQGLRLHSLTAGEVKVFIE